MSAQETWKDIAGYEGYYQVSNLGQVRSVGRVVAHPADGPKKLKGKVLTQTISGKTPYRTVGLHVEGCRKRRGVHQLVAEAFLGPCPDGHEVCHGPKGHLENNVANLRYGTRSQNHLDKRRDGTNGAKPVVRGDGVTYPGIKEAAKAVSVDHGRLGKVCNNYVSPTGKRHLTAGGHTWKYQTQGSEV